MKCGYYSQGKEFEKFTFDKGNLRNIIKMENTIAFSWGSHGIVLFEDNKKYYKYKKLFDELIKCKGTGKL